MEVFLRRLNGVAASSASSFRRGINKNGSGCLRAFPEPSARGVRGFSSSPSTFHQNGSLSDPLRTEGVAGLSGQRFHAWPNGGGSFHESATIDPTARVEMGAIIHEKAVLGANVCVGSGTVIGPSVAVGQSCSIGANFKTGFTCFAPIILQLSFFDLCRYNVSLSNCTIGDSCMIHSGVCIGQDGFGFFVDEHGQVIKKPQTLHARIGNNVEIGANTCIDRGSWRDTVIGDGTKIDNLVQIGHNVIIGKNCLLCGQVGIAGSACLGDYVVLGGRAAVKDHVTITSKVRLAANSCVIKDIKEPGDYGGFPAVPIGQWRRLVAAHRV